MKFSAITSILLILYCCIGFYLPTYIESASYIEPKTGLTAELMTAIDSADEVAAKEIARNLAEQVNLIIPDRNEAISQTSGMYLHYDKILLPLLFLHFFGLYHLVIYKRKK